MALFGKNIKNGFNSIKNSVSNSFKNWREKGFTERSKTNNKKQPLGATNNRTREKRKQQGLTNRTNRERGLFNSESGTTKYYNPERIKEERRIRRELNKNKTEAEKKAELEQKKQQQIERRRAADEKREAANKKREEALKKRNLRNVGESLKIEDRKSNDGDKVDFFSKNIEYDLRAKDAGDIKHENSDRLNRKTQVDIDRENSRKLEESQNRIIDLTFAIESMTEAMNDLQFMQSTRSLTNAEYKKLLDYKERIDAAQEELNNVYQLNPMLKSPENFIKQYV